MVKKYRLELCLPWVELYGSVPEDQLFTVMEEAGLARNQTEAESLLKEALELHARQVRRHRAKLDARILSGKSKYATEIELAEGRCAFRHTEWFDPPSRLEISPDWQSVRYETEAESRAVWLDSFLQIPPRKNPPLARLITSDGASVLFYDRKPT